MPVLRAQAKAPLVLAWCGPMDSESKRTAGSLARATRRKGLSTGMFVSCPLLGNALCEGKRFFSLSKRDAALERFC